MGDPTALAAAIDRLSGEPTLRAALSAGAEAAAGAFTAQAMTAAYRGLYELALEQRKVPA
jgi:hypothetical protein